MTLTLICRNKGKKDLYKCQCGNETLAFRDNVNSGHTKSCGCLRVKVTKARATTHGHKANGKRTKAYATWVNMKTRCNNVNRPEAKNYINRGIVYCPEWEIFENFLADMGEPSSPDLSIDRIDNNKGYSKENCRWVTSAVQNLNKRNCTAYTYQGKTQTISEWGRELGINYVTLIKRLQRGISIDVAFSNKGYLKVHEKYHTN
jgi:hypothetical protein